MYLFIFSPSPLPLSLFYTFTHRHPLLHTHHAPPHLIHLSTSTHIRVCKNVVYFTLQASINKQNPFELLSLATSRRFGNLRWQKKLTRVQVNLGLKLVPTSGN